MKKILAIFLAFILVTVAYLVLTPSPKGVVILEYHRVSDEIDDDGKKYTVSVKDFRDELQFLKDNGYETISLREFMQAKKGKFNLPEKPIILTFDDGYKDNYDVLLPILEEFYMKATVYMITNEIGKEGYLNYDELKDMQNRGIELGSHTANHIPLTTLPPEKQIDEIKLSKLMLEWKGIDTIYTFSYPNGAYDESLVKILQENEYLTAVTGETGINDFNTNPYLLHRIHIVNPIFGIYEFRYRLLKGEVYNKLGIFNREIEK